MGRKTSLILRRNQGDIIKNEYWLSCKVAVICQILFKHRFLEKILKNTLISNFIKIRPVADELFHVHRQTDRQAGRQT
jgi:hypothetical protein